MQVVSETTSPQGVGQNADRSARDGDFPHYNAAHSFPTLPWNHEGQTAAALSAALCLPPAAAAVPTTLSSTADRCYRACRGRSALRIGQCEIGLRRSDRMKCRWQAEGDKLMAGEASQPEASSLDK